LRVVHWSQLHREIALYPSQLDLLGIGRKLPTDFHYPVEVLPMSGADLCSPPAVDGWNPKSS
jgi:hypothetical protein